MLGKKPVILHDSGHRRIAVTRKIRMKPARQRNILRHPQSELLQIIQRLIFIALRRGDDRRDIPIQQAADRSILISDSTAFRKADCPAARISASPSEKRQHGSFG